MAMSLKRYLSLVPFYITALLHFADLTSAAGAAGQYVSITGSQTGVNSQTNARPFRRNILDLQQDGPSWSLYIQCLNTMQNVDENDPLSWFQIAGIHGRPYATWNGIGPVQDYAYGGYCTHSSVLFTTWHRPYLVLLEQVLTQCAQNTAKQYSGANSAVYQTAANNLRLPYWDWATDPRMPDIVSAASVQVNTPSGLSYVRNPLFSYRFKRFPLDTTQFPPTTLSVYPQTVRRPLTNTADAISDIAGINNLMLGGKIMQGTYDALTKGFGQYNTFASAQTPGPSIENVHNDIHTYTGGNGHMTYLDFSAFDPLFWLHHANIDRLFAMWQAINPYSPMISSLEPGTYSISHNNLDTSMTPLYPFTSTTAGQLYTSQTSFNIAKFSYAYPEVEDWHQTPDQLKRNVTAQINQMYDPNGLWKNTPAQIGARSALKAGDVTREWSLACKVAKYDLNGEMFHIRMFLGDVPGNPKDWALSPTLIGTMFVMPASYSGPKPFPVIVVHDEWSLTRAVIDAGYNPNNLHEVGSYLKKNLLWRIQKLDETVVHTKELESLEVSVFEQKLQMPTQVTELPKFGTKRIYHIDVTKHKLGGLATTTGT